MLTRGRASSRLHIGPDIQRLHPTPTLTGCLDCGYVGIYWGTHEALWRGCFHSGVCGKGPFCVAQLGAGLSGWKAINEKGQQNTAQNKAKD